MPAGNPCCCGKLWLYGAGISDTWHWIANYPLSGIYMKKYIIALAMVAVLSARTAYLAEEESGEALFERYCSQCHGERDVRSGTVVYYSKETIMLRYKNRQRQLLYKLRNIEKTNLRNEMISAVHRIRDERVLERIVKYIAQPEKPDDGGRSKGL